MYSVLKMCTKNNGEILVYKNCFYWRKLRHMASLLRLFEIIQIKTNSVVQGCQIGQQFIERKRVYGRSWENSPINYQS